MRVEFKINLGLFPGATKPTYEMMGVASGEHDKWEDCMKEVLNFLLEIQHPAVQRFAKEFVQVKVEEPTGKKRIRRRSERD
ncbi:hypothetical protein KAX02_03535 [candidate division WOR-3 bacterium]|nr:hypothetical protein [candidate division WOR-3 bacterium]